MNEDINNSVADFSKKTGFLKQKSMRYLLSLSPSHFLSPYFHIRVEGTGRGGEDQRMWLFVRGPCVGAHVAALLSVL